MAAAAFGILNRNLTAAQPLTGNSAAPMSAAKANATSGSSGTSSSTSSSSASISANDFLTLLVTEMKNQDPTANTDPNQYINQLVQVNSLEQLISINQTLSSNSTSTTGGTTTKTQAVGAAAQPDSNSLANTNGTAGDSLSALSQAKAVQGNLSVPTASPAAEGVARALGVR